MPIIRRHQLLVINRTDAFWEIVFPNEKSMSEKLGMRTRVGWMRKSCKIKEKEKPSSSANQEFLIKD